MENRKVLNKLESVLNCSHARSKNQFVVIRTVLKNGGKASRTLASKALARANKSTNAKAYRSLVVFDVLTIRKHILEKDDSGAETVFYLPDFDKLKADEIEHYIKEFSKRAGLFEEIVHQ